MIIEARGDVVKLEGALVRNYWPSVQAAANLLLRRHPQGILIDGSEVSAVSSEGVKTFTDAMDYIERFHARIIVCGLPAAAMTAVRCVPGARSRLPIADNMDEARASLALSRSRARDPKDRRRILHNILVPLLRIDAPDAAVKLASRLAKTEGDEAHLHLAYVMEVPRHLPLSSPLPEEETIASAMLKEYEDVARAQNVHPMIYFWRARDAGEEIIQRSKELKANMIVLAYAPTHDSDDPMLRIIRTVADRAPCEVLLNKVIDPARKQK